jgi:hypothetical protein
MQGTLTEEQCLLSSMPFNRTPPGYNNVTLWQLHCSISTHKAFQFSPNVALISAKIGRCWIDTGKLSTVIGFYSNYFVSLPSQIWGATLLVWLSLLRGGVEAVRWVHRSHTGDRGEPTPNWGSNFHLDRFSPRQYKFPVCVNVARANACHLRMNTRVGESELSLGVVLNSTWIHLYSTGGWWEEAGSL